jgi:signal transduction histidine kinase
LEGKVFRRQHLTGELVLTIGARWIGWVSAAAIVLGEKGTATPSTGELSLLVFTLVETLAVTLYVAYLEPPEREDVERGTRRRIDWYFLLGLIDLTVALSIMASTGGRDSDYYLFGLSALLVPASQLSFRAVAALCAAFVTGYVLEAIFVEGPREPWRGGEGRHFAVLVALPFVIALLVQMLSSTARRLRAEQEHTRRLQEEREQLIASEERARISREIHDGVSQSVYMLQLGLESAVAEAGPETGLGRRLGELVDLAKRLLLEVRQYIFDLRPLLAEEAGIGVALESQAREFSAVSGLPVSFHVVGEEVPLPVSHSAALYRIAQEGLANAFRHAHASSVAVEVVFEPDAVKLDVLDDGTGFTPEPIEGHGLSNIKERVERLGGNMKVESRVGQGTRLRASLPNNGHGTN